MKVVSIIVAFLFAVTLSAQDVKKIKVTDLEKIMAESTGPMVINFWATWCRPCIEEIPHFQERVKAHEKDKVKLLLVSLDMQDQFPAGLMEFAKKRNFTAPIAWLDETNADYFCPKVDSSWSGSLPATLLLNHGKNYRKFFEKQLSAAELEKEIQEMLK